MSRLVTVCDAKKWGARAGAIALLLGLAGCTEAAPRGDEADEAIAQARYNAAQAEARAATLHAEVEAVRGQLFKLEQYQAEARREQAKLLARIDRLLELGKRTYQATTAQQPVAATLYGDDMPAPGPRQLEQRALLRALDRLDLTTEQKRALMQMMQTPRQLDGENPWDGEVEWH